MEYGHARERGGKNLINFSGLVLSFMLVVLLAEPLQADF